MNYFLIVDDNPLDRELARSLLSHVCPARFEFASNGLEALEYLETSAPLAILTDLQMPEMDGLALVRAVRKRYATVPIILMTAHGSEEIAVEALVEGAADYIPKHRLSHDLKRVMESVLLTASGDARHVQITHCLRYQLLRYEVASQLELIPPLADQLQQAAFDLGLIAACDRVRLARCLAESLRNAVCHGQPKAAQGGEGEGRATIHVTAELTPSEGVFVIRDSGPGFDPTATVDPRQSPSRLVSDRGRGLSLVTLYMDEVTFNAKGNEIRLVKRRTLAAASVTLPATISA